MKKNIGIILITHDKLSNSYCEIDMLKKTESIKETSCYSWTCRSDDVIWVLKKSHNQRLGAADDPINHVPSLQVADGDRVISSPH